MYKSIHNFKVKDLLGEPVSLSDYKGKVVLIVNIASQCGFVGQLQALEQIYRKFQARGFEILAFPSNQFGNQEPLKNGAIQEFCAMQYGTSFRIMEKTDVKGDKAHPVFKFLANKAQNGRVGIAPLWNYQKYLIDKNGQVVDYFLPITSPNAAKLQRAIEKLL